MRSIAFCAIVLCVYVVYCLSSVVARFWGIVRDALCVCRVAFPLVMLSGSIFSPLLAFLPLGCVLDRARGFNAIRGGFMAVVVLGLFGRWF